jgi:hypothetical protein
MGRLRDLPSQIAHIAAHSELLVSELHAAAALAQAVGRGAGYDKTANTSRSAVGPTGHSGAQCPGNEIAAVGSPRITVLARSCAVTRL